MRTSFGFIWVQVLMMQGMGYTVMKTLEEVQSQVTMRYNLIMMEAKEKEEFIQALTLVNIERTYEGKPGCCCGCRGKYFAPIERAGEHANPRECMRILRTIQAGFYDKKGTCELDEHHGYVSFELKNKLYIVYLSVPAR